MKLKKTKAVDVDFDPAGTSNELNSNGGHNPIGPTDASGGPSAHGGHGTDENVVPINDGKTSEEQSTRITSMPEEKHKLEVVTEEKLDEDEQEFRALRRDLPGIKGASAVGVVNIAVAKIPGKNEFFRTHPEFRSVFPVVDIEVGMERQFFVATDSMVGALAGIGITVSDHTLYLTVTARGAVRIVPVRCAGEDGNQNEYARTKEIGLRDGMDQWVRLFTDQENRCYKVFPAPAGRYGDPIWPELKAAKIFRLAFRDKGRLIDSTSHPLFMKWAGRDSDTK